MNDLKQNEFIAINIKDLEKCNKNINFSVYLKLKGSHFITVFTPESGIDFERLSRYSKHVTAAFIHSKEKERFFTFTNNTIKEITPPETAREALSDERVDALTSEQKEYKKEIIMKSVLNVTEKNLSEIFMPKNVSEKEVQETKVIVKGYITILGRDPDIIFQILSHFDKNNYLSFHSMATSTLSIFLCRLTKLFSSRLLEIVGMGGLLHDIGKTRLKFPEALKGYSDGLGDDINYQTHPQNGFEMLKDLKSIPKEVSLIVQQHHEHLDGSGYPEKLNESKLYYPTSIVSVSNAFINFVSRKPFGLGLSPNEATKKLMEKEGVYNPELIGFIQKLYAK